MAKSVLDFPVTLPTILLIVCISHTYVFCVDGLEEDVLTVSLTDVTNECFLLISKYISRYSFITQFCKTKVFSLFVVMVYRLTTDNPAF